MADKFFDIDLKTLDPGQRSALVTKTLYQGHTTSQWWKTQQKGLAAGVMRHVRQGMQDGQSNAQMAKAIQAGTFAQHRSHANALAATATNAVGTHARLATFKENKDVIKGYQQVSTLDSHTSDICIAYSGMSWTLDGKPLTPETTLPFNGGPPRHFNCRSTLAPVLKSFEELGLPEMNFPPMTRASLDGQIPGNITFDKWLRTKTQAFQIELLGRARAKLWAQNKITLNQLVDMRGNPLTVDELVVLSKKRKRTPATPAAAETQVSFAKPGQPRPVTSDIEKSFKDADPILLKAIEKLPPLREVNISRYQNQGAFYDRTDANGWGAISMWDRQGPRARGRDYQQVFAHEFGHYMDDHLGRAAETRAGYGYISSTLDKLRTSDGRALSNKNQTSGSRGVSEALRKERGHSAPVRVTQAGREAHAREAGLDYKQLRKDLEKAGDPNIDETIGVIVDSVLAKDAGGLVNGALDIMQGKAQTTASRALWIHTADFFGAMTKNRIGFGHTKSYYGSGRNLMSTTNTEMFANYVGMRALFPGMTDVLRKLAPKWTAGADKIIEEASK